MKKITSVLLLAILVLSCAFAGDFGFLVGDIQVHPDVLAGFCPTYAEVGVGYNGLQFIKGNKTQLNFMAGGGYCINYLYQNSDGSRVEWTTVEDEDPVNVWRGMWSLELKQGFGKSSVEGFDLVTAYAGYRGNWERYIDYNKEASFNSIYPDLVGDYAITNAVYAGAKLNMMDDRMVSTDGCTVELYAEYAPAFANKKADYFSATASTVFAKTLYELQKENGRNLFSIVAIDRVNASFTDGKKVPLFAQIPVSLGRKVRGFDKGTYNTNFTLVNNFDLRFSSPEPWIHGIFARINLFMDAGYFAGRYLNAPASSERDGGFVLTAGAQAEICLFDFIDLGIQASYLIKGEKFRAPGEKFVTDIIFTLDF